MVRRSPRTGIRSLFHEGFEGRQVIDNDVIYQNINLDEVQDQIFNTANTKENHESGEISSAG